MSRGVSKEDFDYVVDVLGLDEHSKREQPVSCPFHTDTTESASVNLEKGVFNCLAEGCVGGFGLTKLARLLRDGGEEGKDETVSYSVPYVPDYDVLNELAVEFLQKRNLDKLLEGTEWGVELEIEDDPASPEAGYLIFRNVEDPELYVARNLLDDDRPRYLNPKGHKKAFRLGKRIGRTWLVEGVTDALAMRAAGARSVTAALGAKGPKSADRDTSKLLFDLRRELVLILYDNDLDGWRGARNAAKILREFGGTPVVIELPDRFGKDPGEAWADRSEEFREWVEATEAELSSNDAQYVDRLFTGRQDTLHVIGTGIRGLDSVLGGGWKDGLHVLAGEPGMGKTAFLVHQATLAAEQGLRVLVVTYEITKRQYWSRIASRKSKYTWSTLEMEPRRAEAKTKKWMTELADRLRVVEHWPATKVKYVGNDYDLIIVDYLQEMPPPPGLETTDTRHVVNANLDVLSRLAMQGKVVLVVSTVEKKGYGSTKLSYKESGNIEFVAQSGHKLMPNRKGRKGSLQWYVQKNTRGRQKTFVPVMPDLAHQTFRDEEEEKQR